MERSQYEKDNFLNTYQSHNCPTPRLSSSLLFVPKIRKNITQQNRDGMKVTTECKGILLAQHFDNPEFRTAKRNECSGCLGERRNGNAMNNWQLEIQRRYKRSCKPSRAR